MVHAPSCRGRRALRTDPLRARRSSSRRAPCRSASTRRTPRSSTSRPAVLTVVACLVDDLRRDRRRRSLFGNLSDRIGRRPVLAPGGAARRAQPRALRSSRTTSRRCSSRGRVTGLAIGLFTGRGDRRADRARRRPAETRDGRHARGDASDRRVRERARRRRLLRRSTGRTRCELVYVVCLVPPAPRLLAASLTMEETLPEKRPFELKLQRLEIPRDGRRDVRPRVARLPAAASPPPRSSSRSGRRSRWSCSTSDEPRDRRRDRRLLPRHVVARADALPRHADPARRP